MARGLGVMFLCAVMMTTAMMTTAPAVARMDRRPDPLGDAYRPVTQITQDSFTLQWFTPKPTETRLMLRQGEVSMVAWRPQDQREDVWQEARQVDGPEGKRTYHRMTVTGLEPGKRYFYRVYDPQGEPGEYARRFGADGTWGREYAVATRAPKGQRTIIRLPIKVLLMTNVLNLESAGEDASDVPLPPRFTDEQLALVKEEYHHAAQFFFVNSGLRLWVDFQFFVDDRWQRWGDEPQGMPEAFHDWPVCRSYSGVEYRFPGGGTFTLLDTENVAQPTTQPVYEERPYAGQVEQAFMRQWNPKTRTWEYRNSGGGTYGPDQFRIGLPGRSQYLGGNDIAWTTTHEIHHQLEGLGRVSFAEAEHDRIIFNHPEVRRRVKDSEGKVRANAWSASGRHGEHWDVMAFWDRTLTDTQWLRIYLGEAITVTDADGDGVPDDDPRLPLDEKRFGSDPTNPMTDGQMNDRDKIMLATWAPAPLQPSFIKPRGLLRKPDPTRTDSDGDGVDDLHDANPMDPYPPFVWPITTQVDGDASEWTDIPASGRFEHPVDGQTLSLVFKQSYDRQAYRALIVVDGPWRDVNLALDGEGEGYFAERGVVQFIIRNGEEGVQLEQTQRKADGLAWKSAKDEQGRTFVEFSIPNGGDSPWFWHGAGREIGAAIILSDTSRRLYSVYEPYRLFYARMMAP